MCYQISHIISHLSYNIKRLYYLAEKRLMFSYNWMQFSTISLSFYDLLQIFRNCLGNLFFLFFFLFLAECSSRERPYRNGWPCHIFRLYLLDKFCTAPRRRNVSLGCPAVPLSPLLLRSLLSRCLGIFRSRGVSCHFDGGPSAACHQQHHQQKGRSATPTTSPSSTPAPTTTGSACCCCLLAVL